MREIKLRAYHKKWKKMLLVKSISWIHGGGVHLGDFGSKEVYQLEPMKDVILMQYTGLKDKNGKEIYEGDIVWSEGHWLQFITEYRLSMGGFMFYSEGLSMGVGQNSHYIEIIGNIHESPELLEE